MPQESLFFRILHRVNTILLTIIGLAIVFGAGYGIWYEHERQHGLDISRAELQAATDLAKLPPVPDIVVGEDYASLGSDYNPNGYINILKHASHPPLNDYGPGTDDVNAMVVDPRTGKGAWLFAGTKRNIVTREGIYEGAVKGRTTAETDTRPLIGLVLWVAETDTDKDGALTNADAITLYLWRKGETKVTKIRTVENLLSTSQVAADRWLITYRTGNTFHSALYSVPEFELIAENQLPEMPK